MHSRGPVASDFAGVDVVCEAGNIAGECPVWDEREGALWWTDIDGRRLHRYVPATGEHRTIPTGGRVGSFALTSDGRLVAAIEHAFAWIDASTGTPHGIAEPERGVHENRFNDGTCDAAGRFLAGSMNLPRTHASGRLWSLWPELGVARIAEGVTVANGLAFSPDGTRMWWADSPTGRVFLYDYDLEHGVPRRPRLWLDQGHAPGRPDGATVDADGCYWSARWRGGCVARFTPDGRLDRTIAMPVQQTTMCTFGGARYETLFVTTARNRMTPDELAAQPLAGAVFAIEPGVTGLPCRRFGGAVKPQSTDVTALEEE